MYSNETLQVKWESKLSDGFSVQKCGVGFHVGYRFIGAIAYAHNLILLAPAVTALRKLINVNCML